jgi:hypothetical protein
VGTYTIEAWHERYGSKTQQVVVKPGNVPIVKFFFEAEPHQQRSENP